MKFANGGPLEQIPPIRVISRHRPSHFGHNESFSRARRCIVCTLYITSAFGVCNASSSLLYCSRDAYSSPRCRPARLPLCLSPSSPKHGSPGIVTRTLVQSTTTRRGRFSASINATRPQTAMLVAWKSAAEAPSMSMPRRFHTYIREFDAGPPITSPANIGYIQTI